MHEILVNCESKWINPSNFFLDLRVLYDMERKKDGCLIFITVAFLLSFFTFLDFSNVISFDLGGALGAFTTLLLRVIEVLDEFLSDLDFLRELVAHYHQTTAREVDYRFLQRVDIRKR